MRLNSTGIHPAPSRPSKHGKLNGPCHRHIMSGLGQQCPAYVPCSDGMKGTWSSIRRKILGNEYVNPIIGSITIPFHAKISHVLSTQSAQEGRDLARSILEPIGSINFACQLEEADFHRFTITFWWRYFLPISCPNPRHTNTSMGTAREINVTEKTI